MMVTTQLHSSVYTILEQSLSIDDSTACSRLLPFSFKEVEIRRIASLSLGEMCAVNSPSPHAFTSFQKKKQNSESKAHGIFHSEAENLAGLLSPSASLNF